MSGVRRERRWQRIRATPQETPASASENERRTRASIQSLLYALKDPDWEARSAAVVALGAYGDENAIKSLTQVLLGDPNEVVREDAAQSLNRINSVRAVEPLTTIIRDYLNGNQENSKLVMTCANLLGDSGVPEAVDCLQKLHDRLEKDGSRQESKKVSRAVSKVKTSARAVGKRCCVCNLTLVKGEEAVRCPFCLNVAHREHMLEWVRMRGSCPVCQRHIIESELQDA